MSQELIDIINNVIDRISDDSDMVRTRYDTAKQLRDELESYKQQLQERNISSLDKLKLLFLPTATLQEHSISNGWTDEYLRLAAKFDNLYPMTNRS